MDAIDSLTLRVCTKCKEEKPLEMYPKSKMHKDGRRRHCRVCVNAANKERYKNPEIRERMKQSTVSWHRKNPDAWKQAYLLRTYNITLSEYEELLAKQGGVCALCRTSETISRGTLAVDHCHETGKIRGLLCFKCNTGIGALGDSVEGLERALSYLRKTCE